MRAVGHKNGAASACGTVVGGMTLVKIKAGCYIFKSNTSTRIIQRVCKKTTNEDCIAAITTVNPTAEFVGTTMVEEAVMATQGFTGSEM